MTLTFDLLTLKLVYESHQWWETFNPNLGTPGLRGSRVICYVMYATDGQTKATLIARFPTGGYNKYLCAIAVVLVPVLVLKDKFKVLVLVLGAQVLVLVLDTQVLVLVLEEKSLVVSLFLVFFIRGIYKVVFCETCFQTQITCEILLT